MALKLCVLASGSTGNCTYVAGETTRVLVDAGTSCREIERRLSSIGVAPADIAAVCLTHEHDDHRSSLATFYKRYRPALYANAGTVDALERDPKLRGLSWSIFTTGQAFEVGDLRLEPFSVPHDSYDPVGFIVTDGRVRLGMVTDMGVPTELIRQRLRDCDAAVVESNHDEDLLGNSRRPWSLIQRIKGRQGHLSNRQAGRLIADIAGPRLKTVLLAHLSAQCNRGELALKTVSGLLNGSGVAGVQVKLTYPDRPSEVIDL